MNLSPEQIIDELVKRIKTHASVSDLPQDTAAEEYIHLIKP